MDMAIHCYTPMPPLVEDCGYYYVKWFFDHPERADAMNLDVAIGHATYAEVSRVF